MTKASKQTGNYGEDLAVNYLRKRGYKILERNLTNKIGEIDILSQKAKTIVLVEVKTKSTDRFGAGYEMVNYYKAKKLLCLAKSLQIRYPKSTIRIDVVSVDLSSSPPIIEHFENAVQEN
jgi:putative endonuclease